MVRKLRKKTTDLKKPLLSAGNFLFSLALTLLWLRTGITRDEAVIHSAAIVILGIMPLLYLLGSLKPDVRKSKAGWLLAGIALIPLIAAVYMQSYLV